ncbi:potassium transporter TrkA [Pseudomonas moraviensis]|uniref:monovalent cation:proton antiporter-2 (CPA2) family protein n=1 Tax=Pseudomonas moraviensis TaxID=321662 RepID=UPI00135D43E1|nr:monovalent cation:proton antiporter-2 (CPA2) family protein [Pseudomonas moraviensis]MXI47085.1 potassium transporter TrkA [Pseudomonas moraviensis]
MTESEAAQHGLSLATPLVFLSAAVLAVPLSRLLKLGAVIGYLVAGVVVGPSVLGLINNPSSVLTLAELGVVLLLFIIGLELKPSRLWSMRRDIAGLGLGQVLICGVVLSGIAMLAGLNSQAAVIAGAGLALSSTAFAVPLMEDHKELALPYGQRAFSILLLQDLAIVPLLALVTMLSPVKEEAIGTSGWLAGVTMVSAITAVVVVGRYALNPVFKMLAKTGHGEIMTAAALLVVLGAAALMQYAGLSMSMGAFLAGVLLAESRFRHELEANIEPFRGLLLGLFFMAVGMGIDVGVVISNAVPVAVAVVVLMSLKTALILGMARLTGSNWQDSIKIGAVLSQGGEFAFVLFAAAVSGRILTAEIAAILTAVVTFSLVLTPLAFGLAHRLAAPATHEHCLSDFSTANGNALIIGFGRFGQVISQILLARGVDITMIDHRVEAINAAERYGMKIHYGDGSRLDILKAAGAYNSELICICVDDPQATLKIVEFCHDHFPMAKLMVRSIDRDQSLLLADREVDYQIRETFESAVALGEHALAALGMSDPAIEDLIIEFRRRDRERFERQLAEGLYAGADLIKAKSATEPAQ